MGRCGISGVAQLRYHWFVFFFHFHSFFEADHIAVAEIKDSDDGSGDERMMTILDSWMPQSTSSDDPEDTGQASSE